MGQSYYAWASPTRTPNFPKFSYCRHGPKNNPNLCMKYVPVTIGADALNMSGLVLRARYMWPKVRHTLQPLQQWKARLLCRYSDFFGKVWVSYIFLACYAFIKWRIGAPGMDATINVKFWRIGSMTSQQLDPWRQAQSRKSACPGLCIF